MKIKVKKEDITSITFCLCLFNTFAIFLISAFFKVFGISTDYLMGTLYAVVGILFIVSVFQNRTINILTLILPLLIFISLLITKISSMYDAEKCKSDFYTLVFLCMPAFLIVSNYYEKLHIYVIRFFAIVSGAFFSILYILQLMGYQIFNSMDYQSISYAVIIPIVFLLQEKQKKWYHYILIVSNLGIMVFAGGRGPMLCVAIFIATQLLLRGKKNIIWGIVVITIGVLLYVNFNSIVYGIANVSTRYNIGGGFGKYLQLGDVFSDSGRNDIYEYCRELIGQRLWFGYGVFSDRMLLRTVRHSYPHNIIYEFLIHYGLIVSLLFFTFLIYKIIIVIKEKNENQDRYILFNSLFYTTGFAVLMLSCSYISQPAFFVMVGLLWATKRQVIEL